MKWIKCSEQMPEVGSTVIVFSPFGGVSPGVLMKDDSFRYETATCVYFISSTTHWMPLPEAPEE